MTKTIRLEERSGDFDIAVNVDDSLVFNEMLRDMGTLMADYLRALAGKPMNFTEVYDFTMDTCLNIAKARSCSEDDWFRLAAYAGLLSSEVVARAFWRANS